MTQTVDVAVVGGGTAGITAALAARHAGATVCLVEREARLGGECTFYGCVPSKTLLALAKIAHDAQSAAAAGILDLAPSIVYERVAERRDAVVDAIAHDERDDRFTAAGIELLHGEASFVGAHELRVGGDVLRACRFVIATGSEPALPPLDGIEELALTSRSIFRLDRLPRRLVVLGGGATGVELAQAFARFGSSVTIVESSDRLLPDEEPEAGQALAEALRRERVDLRLDSRATAVARRGDGVAVEIDGATVEADELLVATGQRPRVRGLGLEDLGVAMSDSGVGIDDRARTSCEHLFAAGDVTGGLLFTHVAAHEGRVSGVNAAGGRARLDERVVPSVVYTDPEVARVGLTEEAASQEHDDVEVLWLPMSRVDRARVAGEAAGFVKLVTARRRLLRRFGGGELVGATIVGPRAGELIHECALAMQTRAFAGRLAQTIHAYPSMSMAVQQAAAQMTGVGRLLVEGGERRRRS